MKKFTIVLDLGHGGLLDDGTYTTAPAKMHKFPNGEIAYEGVINRKFGTELAKQLRENNFPVVFTVHPTDPNDLSLRSRVRVTKSYKRNEAILFSLHCNAFNTKAHGAEIWTFKGQSESDIIAEYVIRSIEKSVDLTMRFDTTDGDADKESKFYVLRKTHLYSFLLECLFFDNYTEFCLTKDPLFIENYCKAIVNGLNKYYENRKQKWN